MLFNNVVKMLKISQPVTFLPHPPLYQPRPVVEIWYRVGCNRITLFNLDRGTWQNSTNSVFYYCIYCIILLLHLRLSFMF